MTAVKIGSEDEMQIALFDCIKMHEDAFPDLSYICHPPNGGHRHPLIAARLKRMGVRAGVLDVLCFTSRYPHNGLALELKVGKNKITPFQRKYVDYLRAQGWLVCEVRDDWVDAWITIKNYLGIEIEETIS